MADNCDNNFRCSAISERSKLIFSMITKKPVRVANTSQEKKSEMVHAKKRQKSPEPVAVRDLVNSLYARPYSMTSSVFQRFCETQTTYSSHHRSNLGNYTSILNEAFSKKHTLDKTITTEFETLQSHNASPNPDNNITIDFICNEVMPLESEEEPVLINGIKLNVDRNQTAENFQWDFDSDDSVRDKDYLPSSDSSDDSDDDFQAVRSKSKKPQMSPKNKISNKNSSTTISPAAVSKRFTPTFLSAIPYIEKSKNLGQKRRNSVDVIPNQKASPFFRKRRNTTTDVGAYYQRLPTDDGSLTDTLEPELPQSSQKRKKYDSSLQERKIDAKNKRNLEHTVKIGCNEKCLRKCTSRLNQEEREAINKRYWYNMTWREQHIFVKAHTSVAVPKRKTNSEPKRKPKRTFTLKKLDDTRVEVCKIFFLTTLGYVKTNDRILHNTFIDPIIDKRGKHQKTPAFDRDLLTQHVESFNPLEPHYRREHAPLRRYLPSDVNKVQMHKHFCEKYPDKKVSYELYRQHTKKMNISFTRLGNEECEICEAYNFHKSETSHDASNPNVADCTICTDWAKHHEKYKKARELYNEHKKNPQNNCHIYYSADLEKVIMLPRLDSFKAAIFCQRLVAFNQTFAPLGKISSESKPLTVIWHDGIAGRKQEDIMSAFYHFLLRNRDVTNIHLWLDNCSAQNKNWLLYSLLVHLVNSEVISTEQIILYYFEPGHTFMSSDQVHHQVELAMKKKGKLYDFIDFEDSVASINNSKVIVKSMAPEHFLNIANYVSDRRVQNSNPRAYLKNMSEVCFARNSYDLMYKNAFDDQYNSLRFLNDKYIKNPNVMKVKFRLEPKGIDSKRKTDIIEKLLRIIPPHKQLFWKNLPIKVNENDASTSDTRKNRKRREN